MKKVNKKTIVALFVTIAVLIIAAVLLIIIFRKRNISDNEVSGDSASDDTQSVFTVIPDDHIPNDESINVFSLNQLDSEDDTIAVQLLLSGDISICRYSATIMFDSSCLELVDYDEELSAYSPIVYPGKNEKGEIVTIPEGGIVNLEWASATNLTKEGKIITLVFNKTEKFNESTMIDVNIKEVNVFKDDIVVKTEYSSKGLVIDSK